ncbi:head maturation protease, ClpP-related [Phaeovulum sp.]|uniref:head maturation protease, ClpP-related n=1 Tax=Phaeovulum sp. TaxID=2934796 RepID=UPI002730716F|nr:head maturation protease, ClpP-related [Phaeovulum sp.]MDP1669533.1 Clp protease ClpP [Phaeovulum sp.]MDZ4119141.1 Clp protease ClpP [Phaeovulum sp.]
MNNWYAIRAQSTGAEVVIYDEIGAYGVSAKGFLAELGALPEGTPLALRLNSPGGSVFDAVAIYNAIKRHSGRVTVWIDGIAASAASYIAMAGDEVVMPGNAFLMIHDPAGVVMGTATDMRAMAEALDKIKGSLLQGYAAKSGRPQEEIAPLMAAETWLDAKDALDFGFADRIAEPVRIAARFDVGRFRNAPPALAEALVDVDEANPEHNAVADADDEDEETASDAATGNETLGAHETFGADTVLPTDAAPAPEADCTVAAANDAANAASIRADALTHARAVVDLCSLAGQPQMAGRFLERDTGIDDVRAALLATRAEAVPDISAAHPQPGRPSGARPWGDVIARTFRLKG